MSLATYKSVFSAEQLEDITNLINNRMLSVWGFDSDNTASVGSGSTGTLDGLSGVITFTGITIAPADYSIPTGVSYNDFTINNSSITTSSDVEIGLYYNTSTNHLPVIIMKKIATGSVIVRVANLSAQSISDDDFIFKLRVYNSTLP